MPNRLSIWIEAMRPKTLSAAIAPVLMGTAMAFSEDALHVPSALVALLGAILIQIGTNLANDYADFFKGADTEERKGPVRATASGLLTPSQVKQATIVVFSLAFLVGLYLVWRGGIVILIIGVLSIISGILYTAGRYALAYLGVADLFVLIFFGPVAVAGTYYVQALTVTWIVVLAGVAPGLLSVAVLVVNNRRDIDEDRAAGKKTLIVRLGRTFGNYLHMGCILGAIAIPIGLYVYTQAHPWSLLSSVILFPAFPIFKTMKTEDGRALNPMLGATARLLLFFSLLFSFGWIIS